MWIVSGKKNPRQLQVRSRKNHGRKYHVRKNPGSHRRPNLVRTVEG
jgi:hypothetical protein